jgi:CP family cyanate transporter-like MFS transporter
MSIKSIAIPTKAVPSAVKLSYGMFAFFVLVANLRPALTGVGPLLESIRSSLGLSGAAAGLLPTLPLLIFAAFSPFARLGGIFGIERTLAGCLALIVAGISLRSAGSIAALFGGTATLAVGIGIANVLVPSLIKRDFPQDVRWMTTAYIMVMSLTGALATGLAVPLSVRLAGGWRISLAVWAVFAALALLCWIPQTRKAGAAVVAQRPHDGAPVQPIWRSIAAWQITVFMGLQFLNYYVTISWLPLFLTEHGFSAAEAGWLLTLYQMISFAVGIFVPALLRLGRDQRALAVVASLVTALCILGLLVVPRLAAFGWLFAVLPLASPLFSLSRSSGCAQAITDGLRPSRQCRKRPPTSSLRADRSPLDGFATWRRAGRARWCVCCQSRSSRLPWASALASGARSSRSLCGGAARREDGPEP